MARIRQRAACSSDKTKYFDKFTAKVIAKRDRKRTGDYIVPYVCSICGWWHVGHQLWKHREVKR